MKWLWIPLLFVATASAGDDGRISFLEQEVRNLQRQVQALTRQVDTLRNTPDRLRGASPSPAGAVSDSDPERWIDAAKWKRLKIGMSELDVVQLLGPPTSMREQNGGRELLYALEIGSSGFLGGKVTLRERAVAEVQLPVLQ